MKRISEARYHFDRGDEREGNKPDEVGVRRAIEETLNMLVLDAPGRCTPVELRALKALTNGFTVQQFNLACDVIDREITKRIERNSPHMAERKLRRMVVEQTQKLHKRWAETVTEIVELMAKSDIVIRTGLEQNAQERSEAAA